MAVHDPREQRAHGGRVETLKLAGTVDPEYSFPIRNPQAGSQAPGALQMDASKVEILDLGNPPAVDGAGETSFSSGIILPEIVRGPSLFEGPVAYLRVILDP